MKSRVLLAQFFSAVGGLLLMLAAVSSDAAAVKSVRLWRAPDNTRLVFDLSGPVDHKLFDMAGEGGHAQRIVVSIEKSDFAVDLGKVDVANTPIDRLDHNREGNAERVIIDLDARVKPKSFLLPANEQYGDRLVLDLFDEDRQTDVKIMKPAATGLRDIIIAVDPGHGGEDPGAKGAGSLYEKNVTLSIAKELVKLINDTPGYSAFLTRSGDYYVSLRGRTQIARNKSADLFVSIHADAFQDSSAQGASVFALSQRGATSETGRWLEKKENDSDLVGGVNLGDKDPMLQEVLLDLSMTSTVATSLDMGDDVLGQIKKFTHLHRGYVEQAGFVVLKNPDIPSLLVETGFITNSTEAKNLAKPEYRARMAKAVFVGIDSHFRKKPPMDTALAAARGGKVMVRSDKLIAAASTVEDALSAAMEVEDATAVKNIPAVEKKLAEVKVRRDSSAEKKAASEEDAMQKLLADKSTTGKSAAANKTEPAKKESAKKVPAKKEHVVAKGETLSGIASHYKVSMIALRDENKLPDQAVRAGQKLRIPVAR